MIEKMADEIILIPMVVHGFRFETLELRLSLALKDFLGPLHLRCLAGIARSGHMIIHDNSHGYKRPISDACHFILSPLEVLLVPA